MLAGSGGVFGELEKLWLELAREHVDSANPFLWELTVLVMPSVKRTISIRFVSFFQSGLKVKASSLADASNFVGSLV